MNHLGSSGDVIQWLLVDKSGPMDPEDGFGRPPFLLCYASFQVFFRFFGANLRASSCSKDISHGEHRNMYSEIIGIVLSFLCWWVLGWVFFEILLYFIKLHNKYIYIYTINQTTVLLPQNRWGLWHPLVHPDIWDATLRWSKTVTSWIQLGDENYIGLSTLRPFSWPKKKILI